MAVSGEILLPPSPKSPPEYPDLYGKRRELAKVLMLEREIGLLEEEIKYVHGLQRSSSSCKEVADFVLEKSDPLIPVNHEVSRRTNCFWKWLCGKSSRNKSCICCCCNQTTTTTQYTNQYDNRCCKCKLRLCCCKNGCNCQCLSFPSWRCCFGKSSCNCCSFKCSNSSCFKWRCCFSCFSKIKRCLCCTDRNCCCNNSSSCC